MNTGFARFCNAAVLTCLVLAQASPVRASSESEAVLNQVVELNKKALGAYASLDMETAAKLLKQALDLCKSANLHMHPTAARTHIHLGIVYISDRRHRDVGIAEFRAAIAIDPKIRIGKSLSNPEVQSAFDEALLAGGVLATPPASLSYPGQSDPTRPAEPSAGTQTIASRINHPPVTRAFRGKPVVIKAHVPPGLGASWVVLAYRAEDGPEFLARSMLAVGGNAVGWFHESIPAEATRGGSVSYYIEARDANEEPIARSGSPESTHHIALAPEPRSKEIAPDNATDPDTTLAMMSPTHVPGFWFVLAVGTGFGYHSGTPELHREDTNSPPGSIKTSGFALAQLLHLAPEIGFFHNDRWVVSVQGRFQLGTGVDDASINGRIYPASRIAVAGLMKLTRLLSSASSGFRPFLTLEAGAGQIRQSINLLRSPPPAGCSPNATCNDTMVGGLGLAGIGTGFTYVLDNSVAVYAAFNVIAALPNFMVNGDLSVGLAMVH